MNCNSSSQLILFKKSIESNLLIFFFSIYCIRLQKPYFYNKTVFQYHPVSHWNFHKTIKLMHRHTIMPNRFLIYFQKALKTNIFFTQFKLFIWPHNYWLFLYRSRSSNNISQHSSFLLLSIFNCYCFLQQKIFILKLIATRVNIKRKILSDRTWPVWFTVSCIRGNFEYLLRE